MKTIRISQRSRAVTALLHQARKEDVIIQDADGMEYMMTLVDDFDREIAAQRRNKKLMAFLDQRSRSTKWIPLQDIEKELGLSPWRRNQNSTTRKSPRKSKQ